LKAKAIIQQKQEKVFAELSKLMGQTNLQDKVPQALLVDLDSSSRAREPERESLVSFGMFSWVCLVTGCRSV
jgi:hypothetical protein